MKTLLFAPYDAHRKLPRLNVLLRNPSVTFDANLSLDKFGLTQLLLKHDQKPVTVSRALESISDHVDE
jgi:hypothetical protein